MVIYWLEFQVSRGGGRNLLGAPARLVGARRICAFSIASRKTALRGQRAANQNGERIRRLPWLRGQT